MLRSCIMTLATCCLTAAAAQAQVKKPQIGDDVRIEGQIVANDIPDKLRKHPCKVHSLKLSKDRTYVIDLMSKDFDCYLRVEDAAGKQLAQDDDGGEGLNSRLRFTPPKNGNYQIIATAFAGGVGAYTLTVSADGAKPAALPPSADGKMHTVGAGLKIEAQLANTDAKDRVRVGSFAKVYLVKMTKGKTYTIDMESNRLDSYLRLENDKGAELKRDDDGGGFPNARIAFTADANGAYRVVATTFGGGTGPFVLKVREE